MSNATNAQPRIQLGTPIIPFDNPQGDFLRHIGLPGQYVSIGDTLAKVAVLKMGARYDLIGISQHPVLLEQGHIDPCDHVDDEMTIDALYLADKSTGWITILDVTMFSDLFRFQFPTDPETKQVVSHRAQYVEERIVLPVVWNGATYQVQFLVTGEFQCHFGNVEVSAKVEDILDAGVDQKDELIKAIDGFAPLRGYKLGAYRANANRVSR